MQTETTKEPNHYVQVTTIHIESYYDFARVGHQTLVHSVITLFRFRAGGSYFRLVWPLDGCFWGVGGGGG